VRKDGDVGFFGGEPDDSGHDGGADNLPRWDAAVGQKPVDREEEEDRREPRGNGEPDVADAFEDDVLGVVEEDKAEKLALPGAQENAAHREDHHQDSEPKGDSLVEEVVAALGDSPCLVERDFERQKDAGAGDEDHDHGHSLHTVSRRERSCILKPVGQKALRGRGGEQLLHQFGDDIGHFLRMEDRQRHGVQQDDQRDEGDDGVGGNAEGVGMHFGIEQVVNDRGAAPAPAVPLGGLGGLVLVETSRDRNRRFGEGGSGI